MALYFLYECAAGYAMFQKQEFDETSTSLKQVQKSLESFDHFSKMIKLKSFKAFSGNEQALTNLRALAEGEITEDLQTFLEQTVLSKKSAKAQLAVQDKTLANKIGETFGVQIRVSDAIFEIFRGIRLHFTKFMKTDLPEKNLIKVSLGLGHSFSRSKVTTDVARQDKHIIQTISLLEQIEKNLNQFSMRIKEWYSWHFPELVKVVSDNVTYVKLVSLIQDRQNFSAELLPQIEELVLDAGIAEKIKSVAASSMGQELTEEDLAALLNFCDKVTKGYEYRDELKDYLKDKMNNVAPNLTAFIGENVGAKLICQAGSLNNLSKCPASTVQILGAEKALFRALKTRGNTPKYGLLYHASYINKAKVQDKGKISRYIANKCALAARLDSYSLIPTNKFGEKMKEQVEERLLFLDSGEKTNKNVDVMKEVLDELRAENLYVDNTDQLAALEKKKKKKSKKKAPQPEEEEEEVPVKKSKKNKVKEVVEEEEEEAHEEPAKKKKKKVKSE